MMPTKLLMPCLMLVLLSLPGCASNATTPVAVSCPAPPSIPNALTLPVTTEPSLSKEWERVYEAFEKKVADLLTKAQRTP